MYDTIERTLERIEERLTQPLTLADLAEMAGYSPYHFARAFRECAGIPAMAYVAWRRLHHARLALSRGAKVIDVAMDYGFVTHAGFTRAFKRCFGYPPSLCALHLRAPAIGPVTLAAIRAQLRGGEIPMHPHIMEWTPFTVVGWPARFTLPGIQSPGDAPAYWDTISMEYEPQLTRLHEQFPLSKHFEVALCTDIDPEAGAFSYLLGRGIDVQEDLANIEPDMTAVEASGGLYAIFSTPPSDEDGFVGAIRETWNRILTEWLPHAEFEYDAARLAFEYYDHRDHAWYFGGKQQMDIFIPIVQRTEAREQARSRPAWLW